MQRSESMLGRDFDIHQGRAGLIVTSPRWTKVPTSIFKALFKHTVKTTNIVRVQITNYSYIKFTKGTNIKDNV